MVIPCAIPINYEPENIHKPLLAPQPIPLQTRERALSELLHRNPPLVPGHVNHIWTQVNSIMESTKEHDLALQFVREQFLDFLKENNMEPLTVNKINPKALTEQIQGLCLGQQLEKVLNKAREDKKLKSLFGRKNI